MRHSSSQPQAGHRNPGYPSWHSLPSGQSWHLRCYSTTGFLRHGWHAPSAHLFFPDAASQSTFLLPVRQQSSNGSSNLAHPHSLPQRNLHGSTRNRSGCCRTSKSNNLLFWNQRHNLVCQLVKISSGHLKVVVLAKNIIYFFSS